MLVIFDDRSSLGLVRLRVRQATERLERLFRELPGSGVTSSPSVRTSPLARMTDEDIEALFGD